jgi:hypothetical protein
VIPRISAFGDMKVGFLLGRMLEGLGGLSKEGAAGTRKGSGSIDQEHLAGTGGRTFIYEFHGSVPT